MRANISSKTQSQTGAVKSKQGTGRQAEVGQRRVPIQTDADLLEHNLNVH